ncbi:hypothetical protein FOZ63_000266, partial [Perkinsus olseni]
MTGRGYVGSLCMAAVVFTPARGDLRRSQILYSALDDDVHYFFLPVGREPAANSADGAREACTLVTSGIQSHPLPNTAAKDFNLTHMDFLLVESENGNEERVKETRVLRVNRRTTQEYRAEITSEGDCFHIQSRSKATAELESEGTVYRLHPGGDETIDNPTVQDEVNEVCKKGFEILKPSPELLDVHGVFRGVRGDLLDITLAVNEDSSALVKSMNVDHDFLTTAGAPTAMAYTAICNSILAAVYTSGPTDRKLVYYLLLRSTKGGGLCQPGKHFEGHLSLENLHKWDVDVPEDYYIVKRRNRKTVKEIKYRRSATTSLYDAYAKRAPSAKERRDPRYLRRSIELIRRSSLPLLEEKPDEDKCAVVRPSYCAGVPNFNNSTPIKGLMAGPQPNLKFCRSVKCHQDGFFAFACY